MQRRLFRLCLRRGFLSQLRLFKMSRRRRRRHRHRLSRIAGAGVAPPTGCKMALDCLSNSSNTPEIVSDAIPAVIAVPTADDDPVPEIMEPPLSTKMSSASRSLEIGTILGWIVTTSF